jgi:predicted MFS family arabinose efflux permease
MKTPTIKRERWMMISLAGIQLTDILDLMIMTLIGSQLMQRYAIQEAQFTALLAAYSFAVALSGLLSIFFINRFDRKKLLLSVYLIFGLIALTYPFVNSYGIMMIVRVCAGLCGGVILALIHTIVTEEVPFERRGRAMGILWASQPVCIVAGIPLALTVASVFGWTWSFVALAALCALFFTMGLFFLPSLTTHLSRPQTTKFMTSIKTLMSDVNHRRAYLVSALMMFVGFTVIPLVTIFLTVNLGIGEKQLPIIYLASGVGTLVLMPIFARLTDSLGKKPMFYALSLLLIPPLIGFTLLPPDVSFATLLIVFVLLSALIGSRMIPGFALVNSAAEPKLRGVFMAMNICIQNIAVGIASGVAGAVVSRSAQGLLQNFWISATIGAIAAVMGILIARKLVLHTSD